MFPETTQCRTGRQRPQTDWKAQRVTPMPHVALVQLASEVQGRVIAALGAHPALSGTGKTGAADREARKQLLDFLVYPLGVLVSAMRHRSRSTSPWCCSGMCRTTCG